MPPLPPLPQKNLKANTMTKPRTLYDKIWDAHFVTLRPDGTPLLYIDRHLVHEVTSPQAFAGLVAAGRKVAHPEKTLAVPDHNVPTVLNRAAELAADATAKNQLDTLEKNQAQFNIPYIPLDDVRQGIVHVVGPEQGFTLPGATIVCGDSHTSTHGAFGALAFGIGTSEVEHVLATQTLAQAKSKNMKVEFLGDLPKGVGAKDLILKLIAQIGTAGATGYVMEYTGKAIQALSMESRMTLCNMSIEAGARAGLIAPDDKTYAYLKGRPLAPNGAQWQEAVGYWKTLPSDENAYFDKTITLDISTLKPQATWGTSPETGLDIDGFVPDPAAEADPEKRASLERMLEYMGLEAGQPLTDIKIDTVFIGSCTNSRIEDLREAAEIFKNHKVAKGVRVLVVPGSGLVRKQAEEEGLDKIFIAAGCEWRLPGCSMCLAMNNDKLTEGERCASTSNRNFEGRQGRGGRTHLVNPRMAAAAAAAGHLADARDF